MSSIHQTRLDSSNTSGPPAYRPPQGYDTSMRSASSPPGGQDVTPSSISAREEKTSLDFTQRIERKLAEYNASQNVFKRWLFEMASWLISASCMVAIIVIYVRVKDRPLSEGGFSLTWVNVLGKIASAALIVPTSEALGQLKWNWFHSSKAMWDFEIFDKASRGPWGALMLLFRTKGRSLAALGALLIVLLLAIDTFFQQVSELPERWALQLTASEVPKTIRYAPVLDKVYRESVDIAMDDDDMFLLVEKYSYGNGTHSVPFGNGTRPDIPLSCPTSNCTWPVYETLGVCSECADISTHLDHTCLTGRVDWTSNLTGGFGIEGGYPNGTMCGYFLNLTSEYPIMMSGYMLDKNQSSKGEALLMRIVPLTTLYTREPLYGNGSIYFKHLRNPIADVLIVSAANGSAEGAYKDAPPVALECALSWCVKTIKSTYDWGRYHEEVISTVVNTTAGPPPWVAYPFETEFENGTDIFYLQDINIDVENPIDGGPASTFGTSNATASAIIQGFTDIFPSFTTATSLSAIPLMRFKLWMDGPSLLRQLEFNPWLAPNNVTRHMERLATAMTNEIRAVEANAEFVLGSAYGREVFIYVKWEWLSFPLLLLMLSLVFLVSTIVKTSKDAATGVWKTSAMPTLIYSLPKETQSQFNSSSTWSSAQGTKKVRIKLLPNMGWRVSGHSQTITSPQLPPPASRAPRGWI